MNATEFFNQTLERARYVLSKAKNMTPEVALAADMFCDCLESGGKIMVCGNGGSAAESSHFATELLCRLKEDRRSLPALALTGDGAFLTATANDYGFDHVFSRQIEGLGNEGDTLAVFSTSGNSPNVILALEAARLKNVRSVAFLGASGGRCAELADVSLLVPSSSTARIQELHLLLIHVLCGLIENRLTQLPLELS